MKNITVLIKPASSLCNLRCEYCFYHDEVKNRKDECKEIMSYDTVDSIIREVFAYCGKESEINFMFQGGEPLTAGKDYFQYFINAANFLKENKCKVEFEIQTNGTLIDEDYCRIFKENNFLVGVSLDGDEAIHNIQRSNSFNEVMAGINLLKKNEIEYTILSVITARTDAYEYFRFCKENGFRDIQPIYCLDPLDGEKKEYSLDPEKLVRFKKRLFNKWIAEIENEDRTVIRDFENLVSFLFEGTYEQCGFSGECTPQLVIEANGDCYPCDFYCTDEYKCSNINSGSLMSMLKSKGMDRFLDYTPPVNDLCNGCEFNDICYGGCKRYRSLYNSIKGYCPLKDFYIFAGDKIANKGYF